ncbi:MAG: ribosomal protein S18-alanine N-acetyltransferase [Holophagae bacterium]|nr:ribosomal protein S18-alanine N-acetyltransferase [Holophagae bacterium]
MPNSIEIKPVETLSAAVRKHILAIEHACFSDPWSPAMFVVSEMEGIITAEKGSEMVGFACFQHFLDECHILNIAVLPVFRKQGIGRQLVEWMLTRLEEARDFYLEVREGNRAAISLYESMGFQIIGEREEYYRDKETALVMHKKIRKMQG